MRSRTWTVRLATAAKPDLEGIVRWSELRFGAKQARVYRETILAALQTLRNGPSVARVRSRADIHRGLYTLHVGGARRRGRHVILFRLDQRNNRQVISVARILHEAMDFQRHLPEEL